MNRIEFNKTSNIFINSGIVALHRYLNRFDTVEEHSFGKIRNELLPDKLIVENEHLLKLLEEVYYYMGKEVYDTPTIKQKEKSDKFYFVKEPFSFGKFPKMNSFGLAGFITKPPFGPQPTPKQEPVKFRKLYKDEPEFAKRIADVYRRNKQSLKYFELVDDSIRENDNQKKGDSAIYLNEPYTKTPRFEFNKKYFKEGNKNCPVFNRGFETLVSSKGTFAFTGNLENFNSFFNSDDNIKISYHAKLLGYFSAGLAMYTYYRGYDSFSCSFFNSNSLSNIDLLYKDEFFFPKQEMETFKIPFQKNIRLEKFTYSRKDKEDYTIGGGDESYSPCEITFLLIYTFFKKEFQYDFENEELQADVDPFADTPFEKVPISLVTFNADKFASTMRPNFFEEYSNVKFIIKLMYLLETNKPVRVPIKELWRGLIIKTQKSETLNDYNKRQYLERHLRAVIIGKILKGKSVLLEFESVYSKAFLRLVNGDNAGYRRYDTLTEFLKIYEPIIKFGGFNMDKNLQQRAINLGKSIGQAILMFENANKKSNAKNGRKYLISMHKARTIVQFRDVLIRIQRKYGISIANDIIENLDASNFVAVKQYAQIGALNTLNIVLSNQYKSQKNENK